jgi:hypothetical protein
MPCSISLISVNGIVPTGATDPTVMRVTGTALQCASGQVNVTSSITAASGPVNVDANGHFRADVPINATPAPHCGDTISVRVECVGQTSCFTQNTALTLNCCEFPILFFQGITPPGALAPTELQVGGAVFGCPSDQVVISSPIATTSPPINVDPYTGAFTATLPITTPTDCDKKIEVTATCFGTPGCYRTLKGPLSCPDCYRAQVTIATAPCTGMPPQQPVTLNSTIEIPAGQIHDFYWQFVNTATGAITTGTTFTIDNSAGTATAATPHAHSDTFSLPPGTYTATLKLVPPPGECAEVSVTVVAQCTGCPTVVVDPPQVGSCDSVGNRSVTLTTHVTPATGQTVVLQWDFGGSTFGPAKVYTAAATYVETHNFPATGSTASTYNITLDVTLPTGCQNVPVTVTVPPCEPPPCTLAIQDISIQVGQCNANGTRTVTATASLNSTDPSDEYWWQWESVPATVGLPAPQGVTQTHNYAAPGTTPSNYTVKLVVKRGNCVASMQKPVTVDGCGGGCPQILDTMSAQGDCTADRLHRTVTLNAMIGGGPADQYVWNFGDGNMVTLPGSAGPQTTHDYAAPGTYTATITAVGPGNCQVQETIPVTVDACCPDVTGISVSQGTCAPGDMVPPVTLSAQVAGPGTSTYEWDFGDGSPTFGPPGAPTTPAHDYMNPGTYNAKVTVHTPNCPDSVGTTAVTVPACPTGGGGGGGLSGCDILLWVAIIFMLVGAIVSIIGCIIAHFNFYAGLIVGIIGLALFVIGWILFIIWLIVCSMVTACKVILAVRMFVMILIFVFGVIALVLALIALIAKIPDLYACAAASVIYGFNWGLILAILDMIAQARGCLIVNPSGGPPPASSSSGLSSSGGGMRTRGPRWWAFAPIQPTPAGANVVLGPTPATLPPAGASALAVSVDSDCGCGRPAAGAGQADAVAAEQRYGLGDAVKAITSAIGVEPCAACERRAERLNQWLGFGRRSAGSGHMADAPE